ncbi:E3 SUMO-protein ligase ZBED1 isoform X2 [Neodiprion pinetum]|uniref:E3 SUMO-protein ligase ZBED1 isoform X2 n=1 Tax=Neodiprion lecontei TaxID=441921 RepID=A0A6J0BPI0_NEOLC|nr:E3 SUMO-protein ligase ZBED1 isoform X2 [Neodiprion lecontei]XP_046477609.1 E3 SUMO-protein ligase ZBED1 isoform X2 [Neodiprion pinetum]XP_046477618.1 E3 SUMO-protein ligase ZBED1 isoform X2 [Neodiprion pinetum]XP_046602492.1 E3 SUMO-protein ligase ZBED1 isoform X2 [Neodiprion lecontei]XP_046629887.1 E3 SUMO-protein ligase ZBED1-like isoform X2 [Neodiprion virginianus]XP_046629888.1 E3 SUMO-protein ligase ZBED1-like isoform X2 [Neodiprion virginianus]
MENKQIIASNSSKSPGVVDDKNEMQMVLAKMMEEKHTYTYKKLVVPMSMRSIYWKFFGFPATDDGDILTKVKIVCILCKTQIAYNRNTSNLRMHLQNKHAQELMDLEATNPPRRQTLSQETKERRAQKRMLKAGLTNTQHIYTTTADGTVQIDGDIQFVTDPNISLSNMEEDIGMSQPLRVMIKGGTGMGNSGQNVAFLMPEENQIQQSGIDGKTVSDAIAEFIIMDLQLPEVVEGRGFQRLIATLRSPCEIPSKNKLEDEIIPKVYDTFRESVATNLSCVSGEFGLVIEEWRSFSGESFATVSIYYQNMGEPSLECKVLTTLHIPVEWGETQWGTAVDSLLLDWDLRVDRVTAVVVGTSRAELLAALSTRGLALVPCLLHTLQVCAQACFENTEVATILTKCRTAIGAIVSHPAACAALLMQEQILELEENAMVMDYPPVWTSTYQMLEQMVLRRNIIASLLDGMEGIDPEIVSLSNEQWKIVEDLVTVLEPFKVTIMTLSEEKMPLISLLKPLLWQLVSSHLKVKDSDSETARSFKESLSDMLCDRYADPSVTLLLQTATTLDPRFKQLPYATEEDKNMVAGPIKEMLTKLIEEEGGEQSTKIEDEPSSKKNRLSGMELLLGGLCATKTGMPAEEKADLELVQYQSEATAPLDYCPLQWWAKITAKCPNLGRLARRYNCVPACCAPPARIPADMQVLYDTRRAALPPHLADKLLFLHSNHNV